MKLFDKICQMAVTTYMEEPEENVHYIAQMIDRQCQKGREDALAEILTPLMDAYDRRTITDLLELVEEDAGRVMLQDLLHQIPRPIHPYQSRSSPIVYPGERRGAILPDPGVSDDTNFLTREERIERVLGHVISRTHEEGPAPLFRYFQALDPVDLEASVQYLDEMLDALPEETRERYLQSRVPVRQNTLYELSREVPDVRLLKSESLIQRLEEYDRGDLWSSFCDFLLGEPSHRDTVLWIVHNRLNELEREQLVEDLESFEDKPCIFPSDLDVDLSQLRMQKLVYTTGDAVGWALLMKGEKKAPLHLCRWTHLCPDEDLALQMLDRLVEMGEVTPLEDDLLLSRWPLALPLVRRDGDQNVYRGPPAV